VTPPDVDLSVVVPAYDEAVVIAGSLQRLGAFLAEWPGGAEILVVDDGSDDGTFGIVEALIGRLGVPMRLHRHPENQGKGAAVRTGMLRARGRLAGFIDADLAYPPEVFTDFARAIDAGADVVVGRRRYASAPPSAARRAAHAAYGVAVKAVLDVPVSDTQCGVKLFRGDLARALFAITRLRGLGFDTEVLHIAARWGMRVVEEDAPLTTPSTKSAVRLFADPPRMLLDLARARMRRVPPRPSSLA